MSTGDLGEAARPDRLSYWMASAPGLPYAVLAGEATVEVAVVGGGIVGLTTALALAEAGVSTVLLEANRIAAGVSGFTTAKVTAGHGQIYTQLEERHGAEAARLYAESQLVAVAAALDLCHSHGIDCELERVGNFLVARDDTESAQLEAEMAAADRAGLAVRRVADMEDIPFPAVGAIALDAQAQFHPRRYLLGLAAALASAGGRIQEGSPVTEITGSGPFTLRTDRATVRARSVVVATHYPIVEQGFFVTRIHPRRSYVVAAPARSDLPEGMFITVGQPTRSVRTTPLADGRRLVLVGGEGHHVGREEDTESRYEVLKGFMRDNFDVGETLYRWSTQDNFSIDGLPYIGRIGDAGELYVATGFGGWGMSNGTLAGLVISDALQGKDNAWSSLYDPARRSLLTGAKAFVTENVATAPHQVEVNGGASDGSSGEDILPGRGTILARDGSRYAVSRSDDGALHVVSAACTHMGCTVSWNYAESSWDCPCHGSRFAPDGRVLHGPALHPLEPRTLGSQTSEPTS